MAEELKKVADDIVDKVLDSADTELNTTAPNIPDSHPQDVPDKKSLLCTMFCPNAWFSSANLNKRGKYALLCFPLAATGKVFLLPLIAGFNSTVENLIYWRDPRSSAPVFAGVLLILLALTYASLISVTAYVSLFLLTGTIAFRIYKNIVQAIQKTGNGHPFKEYLELDISLSQERVQEITQVIVAHLNAALIELRRLFLVEDLVDSIKFGILLWVLTYLGSWFNGMTLVIMFWVTLFTLPKVYEANQTQIDANFEIVRIKVAEIAAKVKGAIPTGKKIEKVE